MAANPYVEARREWDERYADLVLGKRNWQIAAERRDASELSEPDPLTRPWPSPNHATVGSVGHDAVRIRSFQRTPKLFVTPGLRIFAHSVTRKSIAGMKRLDHIRNRLFAVHDGGVLSSDQLKQAARTELANDRPHVVRLKVAIHRVRRHRAKRIAHPWLAHRHMFGDCQKSVRHEAFGETRQDDLPLHPVESLADRNERVAWIQRDLLDWSANPVDSRRVAARQRLALENHAFGDVNRIDAIRELRQLAGKETGAAARVENRTRPRVSFDKPAQNFEHSRRIARPKPVRVDDALIFEDVGVLTAELLGPRNRSAVIRRH